MRIRRYAARLLSSTSTSPATANAAPSSSPPPPPAASWLHAAADDDCCAFCELSRPAPQEGPDAIKHKGHIAGRLPESEVRGDERVGLAQRPPAPEVKKCKTDHGTHANKISVGLQAPRGASGVSEAAVKPEALVSEADAEPAAKPGPLVVNAAAIRQQEVNCKTSLVSVAAKPEVTKGNPLVNGSTTELEVLKGAPVADEAAHDPEVTDRVTGPSSVMNGSCAVLEPMRGTSLVDEASSELELTQVVSPVCEAVTIPREAAEPEDTGRASCNADDAAALDKPQLPTCDPNIGSVQVGNAGETVISALQPSACDAAKVGDSVNSTGNRPVRSKGPTVEGRARNDRPVTPSVSCLVDIVARSIGTSGRTDVICYARRRGKKKLDLLEVKIENIELEDGVICEEEETLERTGHCKRALSTAGSADVKLADIKKELMDNSAARKVKKTKRNRFECNIDYCRMAFKTKTELSVHKKNMCTVKSCSRHFRSHRYLRRHQSVHNDDMPYKCPWDGCGMAFKLSWDRAEHFKVHAGVKPYKCTTPGCKKIYKFVSDFTRHRRRCKPQR